METFSVQNIFWGQNLRVYYRRPIEEKTQRKTDNKINDRSTSFISLDQAFLEKGSSGDFNQHPHPQTRDFSKMLMAAFQSNVCAASVDHFIAVCCGADHLNSILPKAVAVTKPKQFLTWLFGLIDIRSYWYLVLLFLVLLVFGFIAIRSF